MVEGETRLSRAEQVIESIPCSSTQKGQTQNENVSAVGGAMVTLPGC